MLQCGFCDAPIVPSESGTDDRKAEPCLDFGGSVVVGFLELSVSLPEYLFGLCLSVVLGDGGVAFVVDEFSEYGCLLGEGDEFDVVVYVGVELCVVVVEVSGSKDDG